jgi:hypothetical protein
MDPHRHKLSGASRGIPHSPRKPLLEKVSHQPEEAEEPMAAMAQYYLTRFSNDSNSSEEERRELAWPHLVRAADLGRQDAEALDLLGKICFFGIEIHHSFGGR